MSDKISEAIDKSINKWIDIIEGSGLETGADNCALCQLFVIKRNRNHIISFDCQKCPICQYIGKIGCRDTPYDKWARLIDSLCIDYDHSFICLNYLPEYLRFEYYDNLVQAAKEELEFLKEIKKWYSEKNKGQI